MAKPTFEQKLGRVGWLFVAPGLAFFALFSIYPILNALATSFFAKKLLSLKPPRFLGFDNYARVLTSPEFWNSVGATLIFAAGSFVPLVVLSLGFSAFISTRTRGRRALQLVLYSPAVLSSVVAALIWMLMFDPRGLANQFVNFLAQTPGTDRHWLSDAGMVQLATIIVYVWKYIGYFTILFITGIGKIPVSSYEAATIDGAGKWVQFWRITLPLLRPTTILVSIMAMLQCLKTFSTQYLFTQGGAPSDSINVITLGIYNTAMRDLNIGLASTMSILLFAFMMALTVIQMKTTKSGDTDE